MVSHVSVRMSCVRMCVHVCVCLAISGQKNVGFHLSWLTRNKTNVIFLMTLNACVLCVVDLMKQETKAWKLGPSGRYSSPLTHMSSSRNSLYSAMVQHREEMEERGGREIGRDNRWVGNGRIMEDEDDKEGKEGQGAKAC